MTPRIAGVLAPVVTPFKPDFSPDGERFVRHCRWLLASGVGLAPFGTNSEANSLSVHERMELMSRLVDSAIDASRMMPGTGACALTDAVQLTSHAVKLGCAGVLMLPPFYYKGVSDEGLYRYYAEVIERVGDARLRVYLYHIPPVSQVPITLPLIERLLEDYPGAIAGIKDSSGDWNHTRSLLERFAPRGFDVFAGSETFLLANLRHGGKGCISATANVNPSAIHALYDDWTGEDADARQHALDAVRAVFQKRPMIAAMKHAIAHWSGHAGWATVRPPLVEVSAEQSKALIADLEQCGFLHRARIRKSLQLLVGWQRNHRLQ
jgi:4-hydroxy-tetrahydrodipicolinate synthase